MKFVTKFVACSLTQVREYVLWATHTLRKPDFASFFSIFSLFCLFQPFLIHSFCTVILSLLKPSVGDLCVFSR